MCQNSDYKIISFLEPGAPPLFWECSRWLWQSLVSVKCNVKWGPISAERPVYRKCLRRSTGFTNMADKKQQEKKKKGLLWWEHSVALKAHTLPCTCDAVNLCAIFAGTLSSLSGKWDWKSIKEHSGKNGLSRVRSAFSTIFHKKKIVYVFTWRNVSGSKDPSNWWICASSALWGEYITCWVW